MDRGPRALAALLMALVVILCAGCAARKDDASIVPGDRAVAEGEQASEPVAGSPADDTGDGSPATSLLHPSAAGALHVEGTGLVGEDGQPVTLFGPSTHGLAWFPQYVNEPLFQELSSDWGANVVRLALYSDEYGGWCSGGDRSALRQLVLDGVRHATEADLYVIVDWHILSDSDPWDHADEAFAFLSEVSAELAGQPNVLYEICNEPNGTTTWADVRSYAEEAIPLIRANSPEAVVIVGTPEWSQRVDLAAEDPLDLPNVMYALHFYAATHKDDLRQRLASAVGAGLPVFVSEFGICDASGNGAIDEESAEAWLALMDELGVSRVMWNLSNKDESAAMVWSGCDKVSDFSDADLTQSGRWLRARLVGERDAAETASPRDVEGEAGEDASTPSQGTVTFMQGDLTVAIRLANSWPVEGGTCCQYALTVRNDGADCAIWRVEVPFSDTIELVDGWNGSYRVEGSTLVVESVSYNGQLASGQSATDVGFQVKGPGSGSAAVG